MTYSTPNDLAERLFTIFQQPDFLAMKGLSNEVPIFIQTYDPADEDSIRLMVDRLTTRLRSAGIATAKVDLFELVLQELEEAGILEDLLANEPDVDRIDMLETLQNYSDPRSHLVPRLIRAIEGQGTQIAFITGSGRVYPFLRTHTILESLQPAMLRHPMVIFFPGQYDQDSPGGSHLRLFGTIPSPRITNPYYRAKNLNDYRI